MKKHLLFILLWAGLMPAVLAQQEVSGIVTERSGEPLPGVNILVKGSDTGTITDIDGNYKVHVPGEEAVLVFSFIGYKTHEVTVGIQSVINLQLTPDLTTLDEVVVTGYGTMKKGDMTSAHTSIGSTAIEKTVNTTIEQAIQGRAAGVYVTQNTGQPGGGISVNIRGVNSINGTNEPLYVIDGVQIPGEPVEFGAQSSSNPLSGINPSDIASIEILQGPSATALYGSRATNGVIVITTKRGEAGEIRISYGYQYSLQAEPKNLAVMNLRQYAQMVGEYHDIAGGTTPTEFLDPSLLGEGTDWQEVLFTSAPMQKHQLSVSGGGEKTMYYLSGEYLDQDGIALGSGFHRYSTRLNIDSKIRDWISVGANLSFSQTGEKLTTSQENIISTAIQLSPHIPVRNFDGSFAGGDIGNNSAEQFIPPNPIGLASITKNELIKRQFLGGLNIKLDITEGLTFQTSFNTNLGLSQSTYFLPKYKFGYQENPTSKLTNRSNSNNYWKWNQLLQYIRDVGKHGINVMVSHEAQASEWKNLSAGRSNFVVDDIIDLEIGDASTATNGGQQGDWAMESFLGRLSYNFDDRYLLTASVRADGSVNFGPDNRWGYFPSVSAGWRVSQEAFFNVPFISNLIFRYETGVTGNQGGGGAIYGTLLSGSTAWGAGFLPNRYPNPGLQWEETKTDNFGLSLGLFRDRVQLEFDYYSKNTDNLLVDNPLPWYMGTSGTGSIGPPTVNIGALKNNGFSLALNTVNIDKNEFSWTSNLNLSHFKTSIKEFYTETAAINRTSWWLSDWTQRSVVGEAPWLFVGYRELGLFQAKEEIANSALPVDNNGVELEVNEDNIWVGDVKYMDVNGDGIIDVNDQTFIGNPWPELFAGLTNTFSYKGFALSVMITGTYGNDIYNYIAFENSNPNNINLSRNLLVSAFNYARVSLDESDNPYLENPETGVARISTGPNGNFTKHTDKYVEDGSFIRLKNVSLSYNLPSGLLGGQKIVRGARISLSAQNIATLTGYSGYDPEVGAYVGRDASDGNQARGLDNGRYPLTPVYSVSVGIDF